MNFSVVLYGFGLSACGNTGFLNLCISLFHVLVLIFLWLWEFVVIVSELPVLTCSIVKRSSLVAPTVKSLLAMWKIWRRTWQPTPVFLPGEFRGQSSQEGCSPWGHRVRHDGPTDTRTYTHVVERVLD